MTQVEQVHPGSLSAALAACADCERTLSAAARLVEAGALRDRLEELSRIWKQVLVILSEPGAGPAGDSLDTARTTLRRLWMECKASEREHSHIIARCTREIAHARRQLRGAIEAEPTPERRARLQLALDRTEAAGWPE